MNATAIGLALSVLEALPSLITASESVLSWINDTAAKLRQMQADNRDPTPEEWAAIHSRMDALRAELAPVDPEGDAGAVHGV